MTDSRSFSKEVLISQDWGDTWESELQKALP